MFLSCKVISIYVQCLSFVWNDQSNILRQKSAKYTFWNEKFLIGIIYVEKHSYFCICEKFGKFYLRIYPRNSNRNHFWNQKIDKLNRQRCHNLEYRQKTCSVCSLKLAFRSSWNFSLTTVTLWPWGILPTLKPGRAVLPSKVVGI